MAKRASVALHWYGDDLARIVRADDERGLWAMGQIVLREAERRAPSESGRLRRAGYVATSARSSYQRQARDRRKLPAVRRNSVLVAFAAYYSNLLEDTGAPRHDIPYKASTRRRKARKVLLIPGIGLRRRVSHPGHRRRPFLGPALDALETRITQEYAQAMGRSIERGMPDD